MTFENLPNMWPVFIFRCACYILNTCIYNAGRPGGPALSSPPLRYMTPGRSGHAAVKKKSTYFSFMAIFLQNVCVHAKPIMFDVALTVSPLFLPPLLQCQGEPEEV